MIIDSIQNFKIYSVLNNHFLTAFKCLYENDYSVMPAGRYETDDDKVYILVQDYVGKPKEKGCWEAHKRYIDIHYIVEGEEYVGYSHIQNHNIIQYIDEKDKYVTEGDGDYIKLKRCNFVIFYPQDAHMTGISTGEPQQIKKVVIKVQVD